jgi:hypothetical protein
MKNRKKTRFVPNAVYRTAFAGVVPLCVAGIACGSSSSGGGNPPPSVACAGFGCGAVGVAAFADSGDAPLQFTVACIGFDGGPCGVEPQLDAAPESEASQPDAPFLTVAAIGFGDGGDSG